MKVIKKAKPKRKESKGEKIKRQYTQHKERLDKMEEAGVLDEFLDGHKRGRSLTRKAEINQMALPSNTPPHTPDELQKLCNKYFNSKLNHQVEAVDKNTGETRLITQPLPVTMEGLLVTLGVSKYWFDKYLTEEAYSDYKPIVENAKLQITAGILEGGLTNNFNAGLAKFYLQNISNLRDQPDANADNGVKNITFVTVNSKEELKQVTGEVIDVDNILEENE